MLTKRFAMPTSEYFKTIKFPEVLFSMHLQNTEMLWMHQFKAC